MASLARFWNSEKSVKLFRIWWTRGDSNPRPPRCERGALPAELLAHEQQVDFSKGAVACQHVLAPSSALSWAGLGVWRSTSRKRTAASGVRLATTLRR